ncbi:FKBP-type peptidyl-prolyl cis-trans isomerase [Candidatus Saccharibacteria bacterium]|nr:FKBP-type peptidyl-prolyl cis-trans isomerase [Candidatus Saccharibacteria bacterium]
MADVPSLQKIDQNPGSGAEAKLGSTVTVVYTGAVASTGVVFESSADTGQPAQFALNPGGLIQGWIDGLPGMKIGGQRRLLIPASQAYGANPPAGSGIPANADLVFDITLLNVQ